MHRFETIDLGPYRGDDYHLTGFVEPDPNVSGDYNPDEDAVAYGVVLARSVDDEPDVEIVRVQRAHGRTPSEERKYLPPDSGGVRQEDLGKGWTYSKMRQYLLAHWEDFVDGYIHYNE